MNCKPISLITAMMVSLLPLLAVHAQDQTAATQLFTIHEDVVIPSRVVEYEKAAKNLADLMKQHTIAGMQYSAASGDDFTYIYISPVTNYAGLDAINAGFAELQDKIGKEAFDRNMNMFSGNYHSHRDYMVRLHPELSYKPEYGNQMNVGMDFRHWDFYHVYPGKEAQVAEIAKEWIELNKSMDIQQGYRLYMGDMGTDMPLVIVAHSAKNASDFYSNYEKNMKKMGDAGKKLMEKTMAITWKIERREGSMRPDLSYITQPVATASDGN